MRLLIVDDEAPARARLRRLLGQWQDCSVVAEAASAGQALQMVAQHQPDALLLDISMPGLDGMTLARVLRDQTPAPAVIFCTAWPDRALEAFDCAALDYLLKPVRAERLRAALDKAQRNSPPAPGPASGAFLQASVGTSVELIDIESVACLLAEDKYTTVFHDHGKAVINDSLTELEKAHGKRFLRVHRNALVAVARVRGLDRSDGGTPRLILESCSYRPVISRRKLPAVRKLIRRAI
jgi:two-component system response regulator AlgR